MAAAQGAHPEDERDIYAERCPLSAIYILHVQARNGIADLVGQSLLFFQLSFNDFEQTGPATQDLSACSSGHQSRRWSAR